jgi:hypothetical protein
MLKISPFSLQKNIELPMGQYFEKGTFKQGFKQKSG